MHIEAVDNLTKGFELWVNGVSTLPVVLNNGVYSSTVLDINVLAGDNIQIRVSDVDNPVRDVLATVYLKWRI